MGQEEVTAAGLTPTSGSPTGKGWFRCIKKKLHFWEDSSRGGLLGVMGEEVGLEVGLEEGLEVGLKVGLEVELEVGVEVRLEKGLEVGLEVRL